MESFCRLKEIEPTKDDPFKEDKLNREQYAKTLQSIVDAYADDGCVLSINGEWGTGKTTFIKMWQMYMEQNGYRTIYYNAWETDYIPDPFISLIGELKCIVNNEDSFNELASKAGRIAIEAVTFAIGTLIKSLTGVSSDGIRGILNEAKNIAQEYIKQYANQKETLADFKKALSEYVANVSDDQEVPLIFIVDELDRCNPHYAVKVLERIKHLFDIPNVIFVLPICKSQLECSIKGFYGSNELDAKNYLRRFVDIEFDLPKPEGKDFCKYLFSHYHFGAFFQPNSNRQDREGADAQEVFNNMVNILFQFQEIDLRTMDRIFAYSRLVVSQLGTNKRQVVDLIFLLCYLRIVDSEFYKDLCNRKYNLQELVYKFEEYFPNSLMDSKGENYFENHSFTYTLGNLLLFYNYNGHEYYDDSFKKLTNDSEPPLKCRKFDENKLKEAIVCSINQNISYIYSFMEITKKIELLDHFRNL